jgi:hypothetical protein
MASQDAPVKTPAPSDEQRERFEWSGEKRFEAASPILDEVDARQGVTGPLRVVDRARRGHRRVLGHSGFRLLSLILRCRGESGSHGSAAGVRVAGGTSGANDRFMQLHNHVRGPRFDVERLWVAADCFRDAAARRPRAVGRVAFSPPMTRLLSRRPRAPTCDLPSRSCW